MRSEGSKRPACVEQAAYGNAYIHKLEEMYRIYSEFCIYLPIKKLGNRLAVMAKFRQISYQSEIKLNLTSINRRINRSFFRIQIINNLFSILLTVFVVWNVRHIGIPPETPFVQLRFSVNYRLEFLFELLQNKWFIFPYIKIISKSKFENINKLPKELLKISFFALRIFPLSNQVTEYDVNEITWFCLSTKQPITRVPVPVLTKTRNILFFYIY